MIAYADWQAPANSPPTCTLGSPGCDPPVHQGNALQKKAGGLIVAGNIGVNPGFLVLNGRVGLGMPIPDTRADVKLDVGTNVKDGLGNVIGNIIAGVKTPLNDTDAANKAYVDAAVGGGGYIVTERIKQSASNSSCAASGYPPPFCPVGWTEVETWTSSILTSDTDGPGYLGTKIYACHRWTFCRL